jgi:hypothetical protein
MIFFFFLSLGSCQLFIDRRAGDNNSKEKPVDCRHKLEFNKKNVCICIVGIYIAALLAV